MTTYIIRLWLPDRPGALGHVASRIGAVGGDPVETVYGLGYRLRALDG